MAEKNQYGANIRPQHKLTNEEGKQVKNFLRKIITSLMLGSVQVLCHQVRGGGGSELKL